MAATKAVTRDRHPPHQKKGLATGDLLEIKMLAGRGRGVGTRPCRPVARLSTGHVTAPRRFVLLGAAWWLAWPNAARSQSRDTTLSKLPARASVSATPACCAVVRVEGAKSLVTARETATGFTFRFAVKNRRLLGTLKVGQPVWADFAARTVKLKATDASPCCAIVETPPPPTEFDSLGPAARTGERISHQALMRWR